MTRPEANAHGVSEGEVDLDTIYTSPWQVRTYVMTVRIPVLGDQPMSEDRELFTEILNEAAFDIQIVDFTTQNGATS